MAPLPRTLLEKIWDDHVVRPGEGGPDLLYIDLHLVHEVTSPQAFEGLRERGRRVRRPERTIATVDHNVPTTDRSLPIVDPLARTQIQALRANASEFGVTLYDVDDARQGIVHVIGPESGLTQPGATIVCGDSHTSTHGAFGALAFGIGTSEVEHVLATQCLPLERPKTMEVRIVGDLPRGCSAKDLILFVIGRLGVSGGAGYVLEYTGPAIRALSMEGRMTVCNMSIEAGARAGMVSPDETTVAYVRGRPHAPEGPDFETVAARWLAMRTDPGAAYDRVVDVDIATMAPQVTWGTTPGMVVGVDDVVPDPDDLPEAQREVARRALAYMDLAPGTPLVDVPIDRVFVGSCTNGRLEDLRAAAEVLAGRRVHPRVRAMAVPGSAAVRRAAEREGLDTIFVEAGVEWRHAGCSMCLGMNPDVADPGERCASTSNRNFEGRQGRGSRTHLMSPQMAAAAAIHGRLADAREFLP